MPCVYNNKTTQNDYGFDGFIADFYCHSAALVVEVDGLVHDPEYDKERDRIFSERGIHVIRFSNNDVNERIGWVLSRIKQATDERR